MPAAISSTHGRCNGSQDDLEEIVLIDDIFKARAKDEDQKPLMAFPKSERGASDFEFFDGRDLDRFIEHAAQNYLSADIQAVRGILSHALRSSSLTSRSGKGLKDDVKAQKQIHTVNIMSRTAFDKPLADEPALIRDVDRTVEAERTVLILHSSGSTGLPKPIYINHKQYTRPCPASQGTRDFITMPL
ncbi:MAG: hypothetical protein Q9222_006551 [Ikaeria aurantiellina]